MRAYAWAIALVMAVSFGVAPRDQAQATTCTSSVGPGLPPPSNLTTGIPGFHAAWYGQSGYQTLCPGEKSSAVVAYLNTGSRGWVLGKMGEVAYLGTWGPSPGQDQVTPFGGDGTNGSPNTGWPRYNRIAAQSAAYVGPGQVSWFQFTIQAPMKPGIYQLYLRPLIEGATWMEDYGVFWQIVVLNPDGTPPPPAPPGPECSEWPAEMGFVFSKLPVMERLCLIRSVAPFGPNCPIGGGCYIRPTNDPLGLQTRIVWVSSDLSGVPATKVTVHEICHSHQDFVIRKEGYPVGGWVNTEEGQAFQVAWSKFKTSYLLAYGSWRDRGDVENFADICAAWYYPPGVDLSIVAFPPLLEFAQKWLPK